MGEMFSAVSLPRISGYIFAGLLFGPHILDFVEIEMVHRLKVVDDLPLTFIALAAGGELRIKDLYIKHIRIYLAIFILGVTFSIARFSHFLGFYMEQCFHVAVHLELLLICMAAGFVIQNRSPEGEKLMNPIDRCSLPVYVIFFALTGAALDLEALKQTWHVALMIAGVRLTMIWLGAFLGGWLSGDPPIFYRNSWLAFVTQAGVSLGLAAIVAKRFPEWGISFATIVVVVIAVNQVIGPIAFKVGLTRVGEARLEGQKGPPLILKGRDGKSSSPVW